MQFNYKIPVLLFCSALGLGGCKKLIGIDAPPNTITTSNVFATDAQANSALAGIYSEMINNTGTQVFSNGGATVYGGLSADELVNHAGTTNTTDYEFYTNTLLSSNTNVNGEFWEPAYKNIYSANAAITGMSASTSALLDDSTKNELTGEAKFIRAFNYFYLTNFFGDVPLVLSTDFNQTALMARTPQAQVYQQIVQDLKDAQNLLATDYSAGQGERIRPNKWAATALLARVYLYQAQWDSAETQATAVINNSQYALVSNLNNVFLKNSTEAIWQLEQNNTVTPYNSTFDENNFVPEFSWWVYIPAPFQSIYLDSATFNSIAPLFIPAYYMSNELASAFESGDKRLVSWTDSLPTPSTAPYNGITCYYPFKYTTQLGSSGGAITQYYMVLRLAEQYLIRAEARAEQGESNAAADLNMIRNRAGLANTTASSKTDLLAAIAHERQVELFAEWGHRWLDLKRTGQAGAVLGAIATKQPWTGNSLLYPIPLSELTTDPNLVQNTGY